jgi:hypothetical protein
VRDSKTRLPKERVIEKRAQVEAAVAPAGNPSPPMNLLEADACTGISSFGLRWEAPVHDGGSEITKYQVFLK